MENFDPMGVHTGDSIVVAPSQTLSDIEYHMMRTASLKIINALGIEGGCNVQMALNPDSFDYYIIEVNPRVSRSSALASKATGYPIARVAAKIAVGKTLDEIENQVTGTTKACFEPALDYCVVKIPRWPFDKFASGDRSLFTQMKATGEVMAIDRTFESAFMKAIRGLEVKQKDLRHPNLQALPDEELEQAIRKPTDERLWAIAEGLRRGWGVDRVNKLSRVDKWFLRKMETLLKVEKRLVDCAATLGQSEPLDTLIQDAFLIGFPSPSIDALLGGVTRVSRQMARIEDMESKIQTKLAERPELLAHFRAVQRFHNEVDFSKAPEESEALMERLMAEELAPYPELQKQLEEQEAKILDQAAVMPPERQAEIERRTKVVFEERLMFASMSDAQPTGPVTSADYRSFVEAASTEIQRQKVQPVFKMVDTCAGEFESQTPYYYGTFEQEDDAVAPHAAT